MRSVLGVLTQSLRFLFTAQGHAGNTRGLGPAGLGHGEAQRRGDGPEIRFRGGVLSG